MSSCNVRSFRACWRLFRADAILSGKRKRFGAEVEDRGAAERARERYAGEKGVWETARERVCRISQERMIP